MLNICVLLYVLIIVHAAQYAQCFVCCSMCSLLYVQLDILDIMCAALFQSATLLANVLMIYVALKLGKLGAVVLLDQANRQITSIHASRSVLGTKITLM